MEIINQGHYYDPPDEPEAEYCEECGEELMDGDSSCTNRYCPSKFDNDITRELAMEIVDLRTSLNEMKRKAESWKNLYDYLSKRST